MIQLMLNDLSREAAECALLLPSLFILILKLDLFKSLSLTHAL
jgi:hypothetical protein